MLAGLDCVIFAENNSLSVSQEAKRNDYAFICQLSG